MNLIVIAVLACCSAVLAKSVGERIIGGSVASDGKFPQQVSIRRNDEHFCGGSIVTENVILTAANCVYESNMSQLTVVVGTNTLNEGGTTHHIQSSLIHKSFDPQNLMNDIALLKLEEPISFTDKVQPLNIPKNPNNPGDILTVSGWGSTSYPGNNSNSLMFIRMAAIDLQTCAQNLAGFGTVGTGHVCTSAAVNQGACQGDSGGPLINAAGEQVGIVSWGVPCATGLPDVFTSVVFYGFWIWSNAGDL